MTREYNPDSERKYTAPEAPRIVGPEPMIPKIPKWIKAPISKLILVTCLFYNAVGFFVTSGFRSEGISKSKIEERIDKNHSDNGGLVKFVTDDLFKPGRNLAYLIYGEGTSQK